MIYVSSYLKKKILYNDSDLDVLQAEQRQRSYNVRERRTAYLFEELTDSDFRRAFRFTKENIRKIVRLLGKLCVLLIILQRVASNNQHTQMGFNFVI